MNSHCESLESRTLLSGTTDQLKADITTIKSQEKVIRADLVSFAKTAITDVNLIKADLRRLDTLKVDASLLKTLTKAEQPQLAATKKLSTALLGAASKGAAKIFGAFQRYEHKPSSLLFQGLTAAVAAFQAELPVAQQALSNAAAVIISVGNVNLDAIAGANFSDTQIQTDVATAKADLASHVQTVTNDVSILLDDVNTLLQVIPA